MFTTHVDTCTDSTRTHKVTARPIQVYTELHTPRYTRTCDWSCMDAVTPSNLKWQPPVTYIKSQWKRYLLTETLGKKSRYRWITSPLFVSTYVSKVISNLFVCPHSTRLTEKEEQNAWVAISRTPTLNGIRVKFKADAILELVWHDSWFWHKPTGLPTRAYPSYTAPGMYRTMKLLYNVDNPGKVGSTAVYPPS